MCCNVRVIHKFVVMTMHKETFFYYLPPHPCIRQFIHCLLILLCLAVLCIVKPYKKFHINVVEALVIISLLGATVSVLDEQDVYVGQITSSCFIVFPFLYGAVFIIYRISRELSVYIW